MSSNMLLLVLALVALVSGVGVHGSMLHPSASSANILAATRPTQPLSDLNAGTHAAAGQQDYEGIGIDHDAMSVSEGMDAALLEELATSDRRTSSPYLHELKEKTAAEEKIATAAEVDHAVEVDEEMMRRVEGEESAREIRARVRTYLQPQQGQLQPEQESAVRSPLLSQQEQRRLRTEHMKRVLEAKYKKMHAAQAASGARAQASSAASKVHNVSEHEVKKSVEDDRSYRFLTLQNGLSVVLVSDPNTTKSAASMDVGNGYLSDPADIPGLAHFLEHMLFLGTEKYPSEHAYSDFIESHGGFSNAYTAMENTNYYFDILPNKLEGALDRFAQFFISPLLNVNTTQREMNAVDSEHSKNLLSDAWRTNRLLQVLANASHPYSKFGTGCSQTLDVMPHAEMQKHLRAFWTKHYTAGNLRLAVLGQESLDQLQQMVAKLFSAIRPSKKLFQPLAGTTSKDVFNSTIIGSEVFVNTIEDSKFLALIFPIETQYPLYKKQAIAYVRNFIEHHGPNSLLTQLRSRGWATGVQFGIDAATSGFATVQFGVDLTIAGADHIDEIAAAFFAQLAKISQDGIAKWRFDELATLANLTFTYKDKEQPSSYINKLSKNLRHFPPEDVLVGGRLFLEYDDQAIRTLISSLNPDNMLLVLGGKKLNHKMRFKEHWYGIEYDVQKLDESRLQHLRGASTNLGNGWHFEMPGRNSFIPRQLRVLPKLAFSVPRPIILEESSKNASLAHRLWYSEDVEFHRPHGHSVIRLYAPSIYASPRNYMLSNIYLNLLEEAVDEKLFAALQAGFSSHFRIGTCYIDLMMYGYNEGLVDYATEVAKMMSGVLGSKSRTAFQPDRRRFEMYKESCRLNMLNKRFDPPHRQSTALLASLLDPKTISYYDMARTLDQIQFEDVVAWPAVLFSDVSVEAYVHGNVLPSDAQKLITSFMKHCPMRTTSAAFTHTPTRNHYVPRPRLGQVKEDIAATMLAPNKDETNSAIVKYWQYGMGGLEGKLYSQLLALIAQKPIFHQLRTKEQLGYIVWSSADNRMDVNGFKVQVQSGRMPAAYLSSRIDAFMLDLQDRLRHMSDQQFETYVETLMMSKLQSSVSMAVQTAWFWSEISRQEYIFQRKEIELYLLNSTRIVNRDGFNQFVSKLFYITDDLNPGMQSCETRGGGAMSVRIEAPKRAAPKPKEADAKGKQLKAKVTAQTKVQPKPTVKASTQHKSLLESGSMAGHSLEDTLDALIDTESDTDSLEHQMDHMEHHDESEMEMGADAEEESAFLEVETDVSAEPLPPCPANTTVQVSAPTQSKNVFARNSTASAASLDVLDQPVSIVTRTREGHLVLLNVTQSTIHTFTDGLMLYPRMKYEQPPFVTKWSNSLLARMVEEDRQESLEDAQQAEWDRYLARIDAGDLKKGKGWMKNAKKGKNNKNKNKKQPTKPTRPISIGDVKLKSK